MARHLLPVSAPAASSAQEFTALLNAALATLLSQRVLAVELVVTDSLPAYERSFQAIIDYEDGGFPMSAPYRISVLESVSQAQLASDSDVFTAANGSLFIAPVQYRYTDQLPNIQTRYLAFYLTSADLMNGQRNYLVNGGSGGGGGGSVTFVGFTAPSMFSVGGAPITTSGVIALSLVAQAAATFFAGPAIGAAAVPTFRAMALTDLPAIPFSYITSTPTTLAGYGIADAAPLSHVGSNGVAQHALATSGAAGFLPTLSGVSTQYLDGSGAWSTPSGVGTVTSVGLAVPSQFNVTGSPVTGAGTLTFAWNNQSANFALMGPTAGGAAAPAFRALVIADLPAISFSYISSTPTTLAGYGIADAAPLSHVGSGGVSQHALATVSAAGFMPVLPNVATSYLDGTGNWTVPAGSGTGTVTSVALALPASVFSISGSPVTASGTLTGSFVNQAANTLFAGPSSGGAAAPAFRALVIADLPAIPFSYISSKPTTLAGYGIADAAPLSHVGSNGVAQHALATSGAAGFLPALSNVATQFLNGTGGWTVPAGSGGTVTSVALNTPAELSVAGSPITTAGAFTLTWVNQAQNSVFAGLTSGSGVPAFRALVIADLPAIPFSYISSKPTTLAGYGIADAAPLSHVGSGGVSQHALATSGAAGFLPALSNVATQFLNGTGGWTVPAGSGPTGSGTAGQVAFWSATTVLTSSSALTYTAATGLSSNRPGVTGVECFGLNAGNTTLTGTGNTVLGAGSGVGITNGTDNTIVGNGSGTSIANGTGNIIVGKGSGTGLVDGGGNVLLTASNCNNLVSGFSNVVIGQSGGLITNGSDSVLIGRAGNGMGNVSAVIAIGKNALASTSVANNLVAIGTQALNAYTGAGENNVAIGKSALLLSTNGTNVAIGGLAGATIVSGSANVFVGSAAGDSTAAGANSRFVSGSVASPIAQVFIGNGETAATPQAINYNATGGSGANVAGASLTLSGGAGTGTGAGGAVRMATAKAGSAGSTANALVNRFAALQDGAMEWTGISTVNAPAVSAANNGTIYYDSTLQLFLLSRNGAAYAALPSGTVTGSGTVGTHTKWATATSLADSLLSEATTTVTLTGGATATNTSFYSLASIDNFLQYDIKNTSTGTSAQTTYSITADTGNATSGFMSMNINNSLFSAVNNYSIGAALDCSILASSNDLYIANASTTKDIIFSTGKVASSFFDERFRVANNSGVGALTATALKFTYTQVASTGTVTGFLMTGASHTALTAGVESIDVDFNLARNVQWATGALATQRAFVIRAPTYSFVAGSTLTNAATFAITGPPIQGANATLTAPLSLWVQSGNSVFSGGITATGPVNLNGGFSAVSGSLNGATATFVISVSAAANGTPKMFSATAAANTNLTLSTEVIDVDWQLNRTVQWATGAITTQRAFVVQAPTYAFVGASVVTNAATLAITNAPVAGTNATLTNRWALWVQAGAVGFAAATTTNASINIPHGAAPTTPINGDLWTVTTGLFVRINGTTQTMTSGSGTANQLATWSATNVLTGAATLTLTTTSGAALFAHAAGTSTATTTTAAALHSVTFSGAATTGPMDCLRATATSTGTIATAGITVNGAQLAVVSTPGAAVAAIIYAGATIASTATSGANAFHAAAAQAGVVVTPTFNSANTTSVAVLTRQVGVRVTNSIVTTNAAGTNTIADVYGLWVNPGTFSSTGGGGLTITNFYGLRIDTLTLTTMTVTNRWGVYSADVLATNFFGGAISLGVAGAGLLIKEGSNATSGVATLVGGTVVISTTKVTANSRIYLGVQSLGTVSVATPIAVTARTGGTSFTITSSNVTDTSVVSWLIIEPAP